MFSNDVLYLFEYNALTRRYERKLLGEVDLSNNGFNNSFVVDGTKDSAKYTFYSYNYRIVKPNSIVWHENTNTWWVVNKDTSQRLMGEHLSQVPHEVVENEEDTINYLYAHTISLVGAFELLNSRDLTDHGYNSNVYNVGQVLDRLLKMSTFEIETSVVYGDESKNNIAPSTKVDYIKTFENYTLASAIREFLDGYNSTAKLTFNVGTSRKLPIGYTELEYIESTGTQYIDTGIIPNNLTSVAARFEITDTTGGMIFGAQNITLSPFSIYSFQFGWEYNIDNVLAFKGVYGTNIYNGEQALTDNSYSVVSATLGNIHFIGINTQIKATYDSTTSFSVGIPMAVFGNYSNDLLHIDTYTYNKLAKAKLYAMQIYQDGTTMVADYIPCKRNSDNELGLYDLVTNTFLTNQGTGTFIAGEEVPTADYITSANLIIIPKSGDITKPVLDISYFDDVREISTNNKTSSGEIVVSNAQNVVSTQPKTFPTSGGVKLTGNQYEFSAMDAILRLPSAVHKVNWVKIFNKNVVAVRYPYMNGTAREFFTIDPFNVETVFENMKTWIETQYGSSISSQVEEDKNEIVDAMKKACTTTLYNGVGIYCDLNDGYKQKFVAPKDNPNFYFPIVHKSGATSAFDTERQLILADKELGDNMETTDSNGNCDMYIGWERGKDYLYNFKFLEPLHTLNFPYFKDFGSTDLRTNGWSKSYYDNSLYKCSIEFYNLPSSHLMQVKETYFQVNYIPMSDLKVKVDNDNLGDNTKLYNQSGKLTDSVAFSKLINSYSKEIANETITRYKTFINPSEIPSVGQLVDNNGVPFVISNISLDYTLNESGVFGGNYNYYVVGEFTMSRYVATKSALTNPNTNIRDYSIPQNYNVKRKQLYRDYYELDYTEDELRDNEMYLSLSKVFNVSNAYVGFQEHTALIECEYNENIGGTDNNTSKYWHYKLETTTYILKKEIYEVIDFKDNNIIGYSSQNIYGGFAITEIFTPNKNINTPITYVDNNGQVKGITILMSTYEQLDNASVDYLTAIGSQNVDKSYMLNNYPVFVPEELYNVALTNGYYDFVIQENEYEKDAIEVPFFEYSCQINDSDNVIIGNNIFDTTEDDIFYFFMYKLVDKGVYNNDTIETELDTKDLYATQGYSNSGKEMGATYDENETYYVGDIVRYPTSTSTRYICLEDNVTGTWDSSKWEETHTIINQTNVSNNNFFQGFNSVKLSFKDVNTLVIENFQQQVRQYLTNEVVFGTHTNFIKNSIKDYDMLIYRLTMKNSAKLTRTSDDRGFFSVKNDAIMILRNTENCVINENGEIEIKVNHFKVK